jgi:hypothetical protein
VSIDFWKIGALGYCYSRSHVLDELEKRYLAEGENPAPDSLMASE